METLLLALPGEQDGGSAAHRAAVRGPRSHCPLCPAVALPEPHRLREVDVRIVGLDSCRRLHHPEPVTKEMLCAGSVQGRKGFCEVGPLWPVCLPLIHCRVWESHWTPAGLSFPVRAVGVRERSLPFHRESVTHLLHA